MIAVMSICALLWAVCGGWVFTFVSGLVLSLYAFAYHSGHLQRTGLKDKNVSKGRYTWLLFTGCMRGFMGVTDQFGLVMPYHVLRNVLCLVLISCFMFIRFDCDPFPCPSTDYRMFNEDVMVRFYACCAYVCVVVDAGMYYGLSHLFLKV